MTRVGSHSLADAESPEDVAQQVVGRAAPDNLLEGRSRRPSSSASTSSSVAPLPAPSSLAPAAARAASTSARWRTFDIAGVSVAWLFARVSAATIRRRSSISPSPDCADTRTRRTSDRRSAPLPTTRGGRSDLLTTTMCFARGRRDEIAIRRRSAAADPSTTTSTSAATSAPSARDARPRPRSHPSIAQAGRIHERDRQALDIDPLGQHIARRSRDVGHNRARRADQRIEEARLPGVRPARDHHRGDLREPPAARARRAASAFEPPRDRVAARPPSSRA